MRSECSLWRKRFPVRGLQRVGEGLLAGVAERRVAEVVPERDRLGQVLVELQGAGHGAGDADHLERVREAGAVVVALGGDEDLGLVLEPAERLCVDDTVAVALEWRAQRALLLGLGPAAGAVRPHRLGRQAALLLLPHALLEARGDRPVAVGHHASAGAVRRRRTPYVRLSTRASHEASMMFGDTPTVAHSWWPSEVSRMTRVTAPVPLCGFRMRTL